MYEQSWEIRFIGNYCPDLRAHQVPFSSRDIADDFVLQCGYDYDRIEIRPVAPDADHAGYTYGDRMVRGTVEV